MEKGRRPARKGSSGEGEERKRRRDLKAAGKYCAEALRLQAELFTQSALEQRGTATCASKLSAQESKILHLSNISVATYTSTFCIL